jgi:CRISPR-associated protein Cmr5
MPEVVSAQKTTEQRRAAAAWAAVEDVHSSFQKQYGSVIRKLPALVLTNGLAASLAFLMAKGTPEAGKAQTNENKAHKTAYEHLSRWVMGQLQPGQDQDLMAWVRTKSTSDYRRATTEALAYLVWLKRFTEAKGWGDEGSSR